MAIFNNYSNEGLKKLSLEELDLLRRYKKISNDKFNELLAERKNTNINEVVEYIEAHYIAISNPNEIKKLINFLHEIKPKDVLKIKKITQIPNEIVSEYLLNDLSWLYDKELTKKIEERYLTNIILKNKLFEKEIFDNVDSIFLKQSLGNLLVESSYDDIPQFKEVYSFCYNNLSYPQKKKILKDIVNNKDYQNGLIVINSLDSEFMDYSDDIMQFINIFPDSIENLDNNIIVDFLNKQRINDVMVSKKILNNQDILQQINSEQIFKLIRNLPIEEAIMCLCKNNELCNKISAQLNNSNYYYFGAMQIVKNFNDCIPFFNNSIFIESSIKNGLEYYEKNHTSQITNYGIALKNKIDDEIFKNNELLNLMRKLNYNISGTFSRKMNNQQLNEKDYAGIINSFSKWDQSGYYISVLYNENAEFKEECVDRFEIIWNQIKDNLIDSSRINRFFQSLLNDERIIDNLLNDGEKIRVISKIDSNYFVTLSEYKPDFVQNLFSNDIFITEMTKNNKNILWTLYLSNKFNLQNEITSKYNKNLKRLIEIYPKFSLGNTSFRIEMLDDKFLNSVNPEYIKAILSFDTKASEIMFDNYVSGNLESIVNYLDFVYKNITTSYRDLNYLLFKYNEMNELATSILNSNRKMSAYERDMFLQIAYQNNKYKINTYEQLKNYFLIRCHYILSSKEHLQKKDISEMFFNDSSLEGINIYEKLNYEQLKKEADNGYFEHKYVKTGKVTMQEYEYIKQILYAYEHVEDKSYVAGLIEKYANNENITAKKLSSISRDIDAIKYKNQMTSISDLEQSDLVNKSYKNGVSIYELNGIDYKFLFHEIRLSNKLQNSTFGSEVEAQNKIASEYVIYSEKLKNKLSDKKISEQHVGNLIMSNPEAFNEVEGMSTISAQPVNTVKSYGFHLNSYKWAIGFSGDSKNLFGGSNYGDCEVSHNLRMLYPSANSHCIRTKDFYSSDAQPETWFYRMNNDNQDIRPDFIFAPYVNSEALEAAKYFNCPIVIVNREKYKNPTQIVEKSTEEAYRREPNDTNFYNYWYRNNKTPSEKFKFLIDTLGELKQNLILSDEQYFEQLEALKYNFYELNDSNLYDYMVNYIETQKQNLLNNESFHK